MALRSFDSILAANSSDTLKAAGLKQLYYDMSIPCRNALVKDIAENLFKIGYANVNADTSIPAFLEEVAASEGLGHRQRINVHLQLSRYHMFIFQETEGTEKWMEKVLKDSAWFTDTLWRSYNVMMAELRFNQGKFPEASSYYMNAIKIGEQMNDSASVATVYGNFARLYTVMGEYEKSVVMKRKTATYFAAQGNNAMAFIGWMGVGASYALWGKSDSALYYYRICDSLLASGVKNPVNAVKMYENMSEIYSKLGKTDSAQLYCDKAGKIVEAQPGNTLEKMMHTMMAGIVYAKVRNVDKEMREIETYAAVFEKMGDINRVRDVYETLYQINNYQKRFEKALYYYKLYDSVGNRIASRENKQIAAEMEAKYQSQKKELEISVQKEEIARKNIINGLLVAVLVVAGIGTAFVVTRIQLRRKQEEAALQLQFTSQLLQNTEEERGRIARDLHDGVSQELLLLKNTLKHGLDDAPSKVDGIINEIRMIARDLHPVMLENIGLSASVGHVCGRIMEQQSLFVSSEANYNGSLGKKADLLLFRIVQEALNNVVKYAKAEAARITIEESEDKVTVKIEDNGQGFDVDAAFRSGAAFGIRGIVERAKALNGKASIQSSAQGTVVMVEVPKHGLE